MPKGIGYGSNPPKKGKGKGGPDSMTKPPGKGKGKGNPFGKAKPFGKKKKGKK